MDWQRNAKDGFECTPNKYHIEDYWTWYFVTVDFAVAYSYIILSAIVLWCYTNS